MSAETKLFIFINANYNFVRVIVYCFRRIALLVHSYHDVCRGCHNELAGISHLIQRLTTESGYKILSVPYTEYNSKSNLLDRVQYLEKKIKSLFPCNS